MDLLRGEEHPIWIGDDTPLLTVEHAGSALAAFHEYRNPDGADQIARVRSSVTRLARVLALPPRVVSRVGCRGDESFVCRSGVSRFWSWERPGEP